MEKSPLFTDLYELTMANAYYQTHKKDDYAVFELFFRKNPFGGEFSVVAGHDQVKEALENFRFSVDELNYLRSLATFSKSDPSFFKLLENINLDDVEIFGFPEGSIVFPHEPILQVRGPLIKVQLLESMLLNHINFGTLIATLARRSWLVAEGKTLVEFGMRRAQGPNGAMMATRSSFIGGFSASSNTLAGHLYDIPVVGTMAHSFVQSFFTIDPETLIWEGKSISHLLEKVKEEDGLHTNEGELAAFLAYAKVFPDSAILLVDTYHSLDSGIPNALRVFKILKALGHRPYGIRLDSGDMAYLSKKAREMMEKADLPELKIFCSNELDENVILSLKEQGALIDSFGIGTKLVTAALDPSLGGVYKLVEINGRPRIKISDQPTKRTIPSCKQVYRLSGQDGIYLMDIMVNEKEKELMPFEDIMAYHPFFDQLKSIVIPTKVEPMLTPLFMNGKWLGTTGLQSIRERSLGEMKKMREDIIRHKNPTPYKIAVSGHLKELMNSTYQTEMGIPIIK